MEALLNPVEARVWGALVEKQITTPDYYPLTLNGLTTACNQKSNRFSGRRFRREDGGTCAGEPARQGIGADGVGGRYARA